MESLRAATPNKLKLGLPNHIVKTDRNVSYE